MKYRINAVKIAEDFGIFTVNIEKSDILAEIRPDIFEV